MDSISKISKLIALHFSGLATEAQEQELRERLDKNPEEMHLFRRFREDCSFREQYLQQNNRDVERAIRDFDRLTGARKGNLRWRSLLPYAAVVAIGMLLGGIWLTGMWPASSPKPNPEAQITPGCAKAILKLADGQLVNLSDSLTDISTLQRLAVNVNKGELIYSAHSAANEEYNELILPRGGEYRLVLSDGTVVRLNSGSTLKYPVNFTGGHREVELTGEAFFDVATDSLHPFCVKTKGITVKAYGTAFNINTHTRGHVYTALVRGHVGIWVESSGQEYQIIPSQLADFDDATRSLKIRDTDLTPYTAWTEGRFMFVNETLEQILSTLGLWYDFEVVFEQEETRQFCFSGSMKRYEQIAKIIDAISYTMGIEIRQEGKTIIVGRK